MKKLMFGLLAVALFAAPAAAIPVDLELLLLVDVSGSVDANEYNLQKTGYVNAFNSATIHNAIASAANGIAVAYAEWSGSAQQSLEVSWTHLTNASESSAFATAINNATRNFSGQTAPGSAINWGDPLFDNNGFEGSRLVMDVSGDGQQNQGDDTSTAASNSQATINGLPIGSASLATWYQNNIVTPGGGFLISASSFGDFERAVAQKLDFEIRGVIPEPGTVALFGLGLGGLGLAIRRRRRASA